MSWLKKTLWLPFLGLMLLASPVLADGDEAERLKGFGQQNFLTGNTLSYKDEKGVPQSLYFGRFDNFDWYFPCEFESGAWKLTETDTQSSNLVLSYDNAKFKPVSVRLTKAEGSYKIRFPSGHVSTAKLEEGNRLPVG